MILMYFTERPYYEAPIDEIYRNGGFFGLPNRYFEREKGADLYNIYFDEAQYAEDMGYDAIMLNEHHGTPLCMGGVMDVEAAILARITKRVKIVLLGNPLPVVRNPVRLAEELAEIDLISRGRLVTGWVRGAGSEQIFNNVNPAYNRELFNEAHDLVIKTWTTPGPFRYEGKHFHYRFINPWALPYQKPHPPIWIPGVVSTESVIWSAEHRYPYIGLGTGLKVTAGLWDVYANRAAELGYQAGPENFGYLQAVFVAETEEKANEIGRRNALFSGAGFARPEWTLPPGYNSKEANRRLGSQNNRGIGAGLRGAPGLPATTRVNASLSNEDRSKREINMDHIKAAADASYLKAQTELTTITGTPNSVIAKLRQVIEFLRPGVLSIQHPTGPTTHEERMTNIRLFCNEVAPSLRELGNELQLKDPFQRQPGSRPLLSSDRESVLGRDSP
jgi:alkanesulfonate monooxygenase SsuD/methylene tetrahydromethanopterin reductase-like flavin-dependent oxidoreductase (luciferase family)